MLQQTLQSGALPALETVIRFAGQRQRLLAHNVANMTTPNYQMRDVSPFRFQEALGEAIDRRRARNGGTHGPLPFKGNREVRPEGGGIRLHPTTDRGGVLLHDRNNRDVERLMQAMTENYSVYRVASDLLRSRMGVLNAAVSERVG
ncbi:MAG: hypothetical protein AAFX79_00595 [Planctomycetota bacterium]